MTELRIADSKERKAMKEVLKKLGATEGLIKRVGLKGYAVGGALIHLGDLTKYTGWGDAQKELEIVRLAYSVQDEKTREQTKGEQEKTISVKTNFVTCPTCSGVLEDDKEHIETSEAKSLNEKTRGFVRDFDVRKIDKLSTQDSLLLERLKADVSTGVVFPTIRKGEIHFYYKGGCLYKFNGAAFLRNKEYEKYSQGTEGLGEYERAKKQNDNKFSRDKNSVYERKLLFDLCKNTFTEKSNSNVVVLDIEVRLNGEVFKEKKCDLVLMNIERPELPKFMFVEGKVFNDSRVKVKLNSIPKVIMQINQYSQAINEQEVCIVFEYINHIIAINKIFGTGYAPPRPASLYNFQLFGYGKFVENHLIKEAKLLVYNTPKNPNINGQYSIDTINKELGENNVMWVASGENPTLDEIWNALCK